MFVVELRAVDGNNLQSGVTVLLVQILDMGQSPLAVDAAEPPEVDDDDLPPQLTQRQCGVLRGVGSPIGLADLGCPPTVGQGGRACLAALQVTGSGYGRAGTEAPASSDCRLAVKSGRWATGGAPGRPP